MSTANNPHTGHEAHLPFNTGEIEITVNQPGGGEVQETAEELQDRIHAAMIIPTVHVIGEQWKVTVVQSDADLLTKVYGDDPKSWPQIIKLMREAKGLGLKPIKFGPVPDPVQKVPPPVPTASLATPVMDPPVAQPVVLPAIPVAEPVVVPPQVQPMQVPPQVQVAEDTEEDPYDVEAQPERKKMTPAMKLGAVTAGFAALLAAATANKGNVPEPSIDDLNGNKSGGAAVLATGEDGLTPAERAMIEDASLPGIEGGGLDPNLLDLDYLRANNIGGNYDFAAHVEHWKIESEVALRLYAEVVRSPGDNEDMNDYMNRPNDGIEMVWGNDWKTKIGGYTEGTHTEYNIGRVNVVENGEEGYIYYGFSRDFGAIDGSKVMPGSVGMAYEMGFASTYEESERLMTTFVMGHMMPSDDSDRVASRDR